MTVYELKKDPGMELSFGFHTLVLAGIASMFAPRLISGMRPGVLNRIDELLVVILIIFAVLYGIYHSSKPLRKRAVRYTLDEENLWINTKSGDIAIPLTEIEKLHRFESGEVGWGEQTGGEQGSYFSRYSQKAYLDSGDEILINFAKDRFGYQMAAICYLPKSKRCLFVRKKDGTNYLLQSDPSGSFDSALAQALGLAEPLPLEDEWVKDIQVRKEGAGTLAKFFGVAVVIMLLLAAALMMGSGK